MRIWMFLKYIIREYPIGKVLFGFRVKYNFVCGLAILIVLEYLFYS